MSYGPLAFIPEYKIYQPTVHACTTFSKPQSVVRFIEVGPQT